MLVPLVLHSSSVVAVSRSVASLDVCPSAWTPPPQSTCKHSPRRPHATPASVPCVAPRIPPQLGLIVPLDSVVCQLSSHDGAMSPPEMAQSGVPRRIRARFRVGKGKQCATPRVASGSSRERRTAHRFPAASRERMALFPGHKKESNDRYGIRTECCHVAAHCCHGVPL